ncbi:MAG: oligosaccharide flippase family protein [Candidatus Gracilibacteria bacterium]
MIKLNNKLLNKNIQSSNSLAFSSLKIIVNVFFPFLLIPYISRIFSVEEIGVYNWYLSIIGYMMLFSGLSLPIIGMKEIGKNKNNKEKIQDIINNIFIIRVFITIALFLLLYLTIYLFDFQYNNLFIILSFIVIGEVFSHEWVYIALGDNKSILFRTFLSKILLLLLTYYFVKNNDDFTIFIYIYTICAILPFIIGYKYLFEVFKPNIRALNLDYFNLSTGKSFLLTFLMSFYGKLDLIILGFILSAKELGLISSAYKLISMSLVFITTWSMVLLSKSSELHSKSVAKFIDFINKTMDLVLVFSLFLVVILELYSENIVLLIFGEKFYDTFYMIDYLAPLIVLISLYNVLVFQVLYINNHYNDILKFFSLMYILFISLILFFNTDVYSLLKIILVMNILQLIFTVTLVRKHYDISMFNVNKLKIYLTFSLTIIIFYMIKNYFNFSEIIVLIIFIMTSIFYFSLLLILKEEITTMIYNKFFKGLKKGRILILVQ